MTDFKPGDIVDVEIRGAVVLGASAHSMEMDHPATGRVWIELADGGFTITRRPPTPQAGDVWRMANGDLRFIHDGDMAGRLLARLPSGRYSKVKNLDFTDAVRLCSPTGEPAERSEG